MLLVKLTYMNRSDMNMLVLANVGISVQKILMVVLGCYGDLSYPVWNLPKKPKHFNT